MSDKVRFTTPNIEPTQSGGATHATYRQPAHEAALRVCSICGDPEPTHVHNGDQRIEGYFTVGRGETDFQAALRWHREAQQARAALAAAPAAPQSTVGQAEGDSDVQATDLEDSGVRQAPRRQQPAEAAQGRQLRLAAGEVAPAAPALDVDVLMDAVHWAHCGKAHALTEHSEAQRRFARMEAEQMYARLAGAAEEEK